MIVVLLFFAGVITFGHAADGTIALFDGKTLAGWTDAEGKAPGEAWAMEEGILHMNPARGRRGLIVTQREFSDFELEFEWKIAPGGNSGLKYRVKRFGGSLLGFEYQLIDDTGYKGKLNDAQRAGALYDLVPPDETRKKLLPAGEFNRSKIVARGNHLEHWLNGAKIVEAEIGSRDWDERLAKSKFAKTEGFGRNPSGTIMLQDHGGEVWFRNLKVSGDKCQVTNDRRGGSDDAPIEPYYLPLVVT